MELMRAQLDEVVRLMRRRGVRRYPRIRKKRVATAKMMRVVMMMNTCFINGAGRTNMRVNAPRGARCLQFAT